MGLFNNLTNDGLEETQDRSGSFTPLDSDIYTGKIKVAYAGASEGGAQNVNLILEDIGGREYRETIYITNKQGQNYFHPKDKDKKPDTSKKVPLPGFTVIDDMCLVTDGKPLSEQDSEEKVINVYDFDLKREAPKAVQVLTGLTGKTVSIGVVRQLENKSQKEGDKYVPIADTRETNFIDKVFHTETKMTVVEARNGAEEAIFWDTWLKANKGQTRDKRTIKDGEAGKSGRPAPQQGENASKGKSLFGNKG